MQSVLSRNWTRISVSISCDDNQYTTSTPWNSGSRWTLNNNITWAQMVWVSWWQDAEAWEPGCRLMALGPQWPTTEQPQAKMRKKCCYGQKNLGQNDSLSLSPAHLSHTTNITLSRIKCERLYFYKEVCLLVHWSLYIMFDYVSALFVLWLWVYNNKTTSLWNQRTIHIFWQKYLIYWKRYQHTLKKDMDCYRQNIDYANVD